MSQAVALRFSTSGDLLILTFYWRLKPTLILWCADVSWNKLNCCDAVSWRSVPWKADCSV